MPIYNTQCEACQKKEDRKLSFEQYDRMKDGQLKLSCECGGSVQLVFDPTGIGFVLKDGQSGGWVSKADKENAYRRDRRRVIGQRQRDHVSPNKLQPNYQGHVTSSWEEAQGLAHQSTYEKVKGEHGVVAAADAAAKSARTYDPLIK